MGFDDPSMDDDLGRAQTARDHIGRRVAGHLVKRADDWRREVGGGTQGIGDAQAHDGPGLEVSGRYGSYSTCSRSGCQPSLLPCRPNL